MLCRSQLGRQAAARIARRRRTASPGIAPRAPGGHNGRVPKGRRSAMRAFVGGLVALVALSGAGAAARQQAARRHLYPLPAGPVQPEPCPPPPLPPPPPPRLLGPPAVPERSVPLVAAPPARRVTLSALAGKGIWLTLWPGDQLDVPAVLATAHAAGLHQLWVRTGSSHDGFYGGGVLHDLVPAAHALDI